MIRKTFIFIHSCFLGRCSNLRSADLIIDAPHLVAHQVLPNRPIFIEGRLDPGMPLGGGGGLEFDVGDAPAIVAAFTVKFSANPGMKGVCEPVASMTCSASI